MDIVSTTHYNSGFKQDHVLNQTKECLLNTSQAIDYKAEKENVRFLPCPIYTGMGPP